MTAAGAADRLSHLSEGELMELLGGSSTASRQVVTASRLRTLLASGADISSTVIEVSVMTSRVKS